MKSRARNVLLVVGSMVLVGIGWMAFWVWRFVHPIAVQMETGRKYMDSLADKDIPPWIDRSIKYLADI